MWPGYVAAVSLDPALRDDLAGFLARRFPAPSDRAALARKAGVPDIEAPESLAAWTALVNRADERGRLAHLVSAAADRAPNDRNLAEARRLVRAAGPPVLPLRLAGGLVLAALVGAGFWAIGARDEGAEGPVPAAGSAALAEPAHPAEAPGADEAANTGGDEAAAVAEPAVEDKGRANPGASDAVASPGASANKGAVTTKTDDGSAPAADVPSGCRAPEGQLVGWWWAGEKPGEAGETITLDVSANVRADYPRPENRYRMSRPILCTLTPGTRQRLSRAPQDAGRGHDWWVPLVAGDIRR